MSIPESILTTREIAHRFFQFAEKGQWTEIQEELFDDEALSIEPADALGFRSAVGKEDIRQKGKEFGEIVEEMHGGYVNEPQVAGNHFAVIMGLDFTLKGQGRLKLDEVAVYEVKEGKIVKEQFFY